MYSELTDIPVGRMAATGKLISLQGGGRVGRIDGLPAKLLGALGVLQAGEPMFYPRDNEPDISKELKATFEEKNIPLLSVESVQEAVLYLQDGKQEKEQTSSGTNNIKLAAVALCIALGCLSWGIATYVVTDRSGEKVTAVKDIGTSVETIAHPVADAEQGRDVESPGEEDVDADGPGAHEQMPVASSSPTKFAKGFE